MTKKGAKKRMQNKKEAQKEDITALSAFFDAELRNGEIKGIESRKEEEKRYRIVKELCIDPENPKEAWFTLEIIDTVKNKRIGYKDKDVLIYDIIGKEGYFVEIEQIEG
jgi:hypothetical protein